MVHQRRRRCPRGVAWLTKKSRASGSASASQVTTLMPLPRALRSTDEIASRFSTADGDDVDAARDPGLDDLVLLGRVGLGRAVPDQLDAELLRRLLGALAAADEVGVALALGHHRDASGRRRPRSDAAAVPRRRVARRASSQSPAPDRGRRITARQRHRVRHVVLVMSRRRADAGPAPMADAPAAARRSGRRPAPPAGPPAAGHSAARRCANSPSSVPDDAAPAAEDRRAAEDDRRDRQQLVAGAGVGLGLAEVGDVDDRRQARRPAPTARRPAPSRRATGMPA